MSEERWQAKKGDIKEDINGVEFEEARRCLLDIYNSYVQTHVGYLIAISIGLFAVVSGFDAIQKIRPVFFTFSFLNNSASEFTLGSLFFTLLLLGVLVFSLYMTKRIRYWSYFASRCLNITLDEAIQRFNEFNSEIRTFYYLKKAPNTAILHYALWQSRKLEVVKDKAKKKAKSSWKRNSRKELS